MKGITAKVAKASFPRGLTLDGVRVVVDCAHGAAYRVAPTVLRELGAEVIAMGVSPDGTNINRDCGSTHPRHLCGEVLAHGADFGAQLPSLTAGSWRPFIASGDWNHGQVAADRAGNAVTPDL